MPQDTGAAFHAAQLRHAYGHIVNGTVGDRRAFADGLVSPAIRYLERLAQIQTRKSSGPEIKNANRDCEFCRGPLHYGVCDEMRAEQERLTALGKPVPNPHVRHG